MAINTLVTQPKSAVSASGGFELFRVEPEEKGKYPLPIGKVGCLNNLSFAIAGVPRSLYTEQVEDLIRKYGGSVTGAVSPKTSYLVLGKEAGKLKVAAAAKNGTKIIDEKELFDIISNSIKVSMKVYVVGLKQAIDYNGKTGVITAINNETGKVRVKIDNTKLEIDVKPENISNQHDGDQTVSEIHTQARGGGGDGNNVLKRIVRDTTSDSDDDCLPLCATYSYFKRKGDDALAAALNQVLPTEGNSWKKMTNHVFKTICKEKYSKQYKDAETYKPTNLEAIELLDFALKNIRDMWCERGKEVLRNCGHFEFSDADPEEESDDTSFVFSDEKKIKEWVNEHVEMNEIYSDTQIAQEYRKIEDRKKEEQLRIDIEIQTKEEELAALRTIRSQL
jgi:hypothetical protein